MKTKTKKLLVAAALSTGALAADGCIHVPGSAGSANHYDAAMQPPGGVGGSGGTGAEPDAAPDDADDAGDAGGEKS